MRTLLIAVLLASVSAVFGQSRTVDNFTLDKYKQQRLAAEKDLRENYAKLGFPSPDELQRQREKDEDDKVELLYKLREERLERERIALERERIAAETATSQVPPSVIIDGGSYYPYQPYAAGGYSYGGRRHKRFIRFPRSYYPYSSYRVTPVGVFPNGYPTPQRLPRHVPLRRRH